MEQASATSPRLDELIAGVVERLDAPAPAVRDFVRRLMMRGTAEFLENRPRGELVKEVSDLFQFLDETPSDQVAVRVRRDPDHHRRIVLETVMPDRPFIVDTIREYIHTRELPIQHLLHPVVAIHRGPDGHIDQVLDRSAEGDVISVVQVNLEAGPDEDLDDLERNVTERLNRVQVVTDDFAAMLEKARAIGEEVEEIKSDLPWRASELEEIRELLRWMVDPGFVFLGYRAYEITPDERGRMWIQVEPGTGLGILRNESGSRYAEPQPVDDLPPDLKARVLGGPLLIISKTNAESPIRRRARMDYVGVKRLDADGTVRGEHRFLGLFTAEAYGQDASTIPILRRKFNEILQQESAPKGSHDYNMILETFNSMPKEELFLAPVDELRSVINTVMQSEGGDDIRVTARADVLGRGVNVLIILPTRRFSGDARREIQEQLVRAFGGRLLNYHLAMGQGDQARLHFYIAADSDDVERVDLKELEAVIRRTVRTWSERLADALTEAHDGPEGYALAERHRDDFTDEYQAAVDVETAVRDVDRLEELANSGEVQAALEPRQSEGGAPHELRLKLFTPRGMFVLSDVMPMLENLGFRVIEAYRYEVNETEGHGAATIHVFHVDLPEDWDVDRVAAQTRVEETLRAIGGGAAEDDRLNALVLSAGMTWREVSILRAYAGYAFKIGAAASPLAAIRPLFEYPDSSRLLLEAFAAWLDPRFEGDRKQAIRSIRRDFVESLGRVSGIEDDTTLKRLFVLLEATLRTNYYRASFQAGDAPLAIKLAPRTVDFMPAPRPKYEVYLRGPDTEASHLRMDDVARGGIRWSDRTEDFRVEVLGLVKTQRVKNAVIVPSGAKGAFVPKRRPGGLEDPALAGVHSYHEFIGGLLEIADNVVDGEVVHPDGVVVHDGADPYLVVAADKGTARLSDTANKLAIDAGFWLGDAFASGGSQGYDHKKEGITARGAWECVKRHFRELELDIEREPFTVVGIGDMSGDVFGNGMLLSRQIRLIAAFDHRHIFIDPDPNPAESYAERERMFALNRSSWDDYDRETLSPGGAIYDRSQKEIYLSEQARERLGVSSNAPLNGVELIQVILRAEADLLWNGGIGTYVKSAVESNADVGDPGNDRVRINATDLRCAVVGEGGNLGLTQLARIEYCLAGGRCNTDALDNSAGVDMSDHEVNLKILLDAARRDGSLSGPDRNQLLEDLTDDVAAAVLGNNYTQSLAVSLDARRVIEAPADFHEALLRLEREGVLDPALEFLPPGDELEERESAGQYLTRPELAVLLAYAKLHLKRWVRSSDLASEPAVRELVRNYFPERAVACVGEDALQSHRLYDRIVATELTNRFVDRMGASAHIRLMSETGRSAADVARNWYIANRISEADRLYARLRETDGEVRAGAQYQWYLEMSRALGRATRWLMRNGDPSHSLTEAIEWLAAPVAELREAIPTLLSGERIESFNSRVSLRQLDGLAEDCSRELATFRYLDELLPVARLVRSSGVDTSLVGAVYLGVADEIDFPWLRRTLEALPETDIWSQRATRILIERLERARVALTADLLGQLSGGDLESAMRAFRSATSTDIERVRNVIADIRGIESPTLPTVLVAVDAIEGLLGI